MDAVASSTRILALMLSTLVLLYTTSTHAQTDMPRIGFMGATNRAAAEYLIRGFLEGLRSQGYKEGKNIKIVWKFANSNMDRFSKIAAELVEEEVDVIFAPSLMATLAAQFETETIPTIFALVADPIGSGLVESMGRPGGNITGVSITSAELSAKRLELLRDSFPDLKQVGVLFESPEVVEPELLDLKASAENLGLTIHPKGISSAEEIDRVIASIRKRKVEALLVPLTPLFLQHRKRLVEVVNTSGLPAIYELAAFVEEGGLMSYGPNYPDSYRRAAGFIVKILNGVDPSELPVEQPLRFELVINEKAARKINVKIPTAVLFRADRVIR